jgi:hypothetical protein
MCLVHLLRELSGVDERKNTDVWVAFRKKLKRLLRDAIRLSRRGECPPQEYASRRVCLDKRLAEVIGTEWQDPDAKRLVKRLRRHKNDMFTFLDQPEVPFDNNHAEREIRPAVIIRKNSLCNRSDNGAEIQAVLMSIYRTLKLRGHDPIETIAAAVAKYLQSGTLPPLPPPSVSDG